MENLLTRIPYIFLSTIVPYLDWKDIEQLSYVSKAIRYEILEMPSWKNKIRRDGLERSISYHLERNKIVNDEHGNPEPYESLLELFRKTLCADELIKIYIPILFIDIALGGSYDISKETAMLTFKDDVKSLIQFTQVNIPYMSYPVYSLSGINILVQLRHDRIVKPLLDLSEKCIFQHDILTYGEGHKTVIRGDCPVLEFVFEYDKYKELLKCIIPK